jgi:hypothetical protein
MINLIILVNGNALSEPGGCHLNQHDIENTMADKQLLIGSIIGTVVFFLVMRFINKRVTGTTNEKKIRKNLRTLSIIYGILMTIQIISLISGLTN